MVMKPITANAATTSKTNAMVSISALSLRDTCSSSGAM